MKLEVELQADVEAALNERARAEGLSLDRFAARALEAAAKADIPVRKASPEECTQAFEGFLTGLESTEVLPEEAFQRDNWYPDRS